MNSARWSRPTRGAGQSDTIRRGSLFQDVLPKDPLCQNLIIPPIEAHLAEVHIVSGEIACGRAGVTVSMRAQS